MIQINCSGGLALLAICAALGFTSSVAQAQSARGRHPARFSPRRKPTGVPSDYVLTRSGFFHPSCVITVDSDEVVGGDGVIRGLLDGKEHDRFSPCAYPRYGRHGEPTTVAHAAPLQAPPVQPAKYDGYIVYYRYDGKLPVGPTLSTDWSVPLAPKKVVDQDIAFFNDILTSADGGDILQPVLEFNAGNPRWLMESEHCCISGNDMQTNPVYVNAGDKIRGIVTGTNCASSGVCQNWSVTTTDLTTNGTTTLNTTAPMGVPNGVSPASLESYGVTSCDMFPASGQLVFTNNQLTSSSGTTDLKYQLITLDHVDPEVPTNCGYAGLDANGNYTLIWGPVSGTGGTGTGGTNSGGSSGKGGAGGTGGAAGATGSGGRTGGTGNTSGGSGNGGNTSTSGGQAAGGSAGANSGGASTNGGTSANGGATMSGGTGTSGSSGGSGVAGASSTGSGGALGGSSGGQGTSGGAAGSLGTGGSIVATGGTGTGVSSGGTPGNSAGGSAQAGAGDPHGTPAVDSGCSCEVPGSGNAPSRPAAPAALLLVAALAVARRRRRAS